jgi:hypothetical protein
VSYEITRQSEYTGAFIAYATAEHIDFDWKRSLFSVHRFGQHYEPPARQLGKPEDWLTLKEIWIAYDGERTQVKTSVPALAPKTGKELGTNLIYGTIQRGGQESWILDPTALFGYHSGYSLSDYIRMSQFVQIPSGEAGIILLECDHPPQPQRPGVFCKSRLWLDESRGVVLTRMEWLVKYGSTGQWVTYLKSEILDWVNVEGFWLPHRYSQRLVDIKEDGESRLVHDLIATITNWSVNHDISPDRYKVVFEPGIYVTDSDRGTTYKVGQITNAGLAEHAQTASKLRTQFEEARASMQHKQNGRFPWRWIAGAGTCGVLIAVAAVWAYVRRSNTTRTSRGETA